MLLCEGAGVLFVYYLKASQLLYIKVTYFITLSLYQHDASDN